MNAPLTLLNLNAPAAAPGSAPAPTRAGDQSPASFSDVMAQQRAAQDDPQNAANATQGTASAAPPAAKPGAGDAPAPAQPGDDDKDQDKDAAANATAPASASLPQQALAIAAMAAQLQAAPAAAPAATPAAAAASAPVQQTGAIAAADPARTLTAPLAAGVPTQGAATAPASTNSAAATPGPTATADSPLATAAAALPAIAAAVSRQTQPEAALPATSKSAAASPQAGKARAALAAATDKPYQPADDAGGTAAAGSTRTAAAGTLPVAVHTGTPADSGADPQPSKGNADTGPGPLAAALSAATQAPVTVTQTAVPSAMHVATPVGQAQWGDDLGRQLVVMTQNLKQNTHTAELRLDPPDLGPLRVTLTMSDGIAQASFVSSHAAVRQAVEAALPQLQQALSQAGISLGQTNVGDQGAQAGFMASQQGDGRQGQPGGNGTHGGAAGNGDTGAQSVQLAVQARRASDALVDTFA